MSIQTGKDKTMKAKILPLKGKYYGTLIEYESITPYSDNTHELVVWDMGDFTPSKRQLEDWGYSLEEAKEDDMMSDSHYESSRGYMIAEAIVKALESIR